MTACSEAARSIAGAVCLPNILFDVCDRPVQILDGLQIN
jgi:hypothetical protein